MTKKTKMQIGTGSTVAGYGMALLAATVLSIHGDAELHTTADAEMDTINRLYTTRIDSAKWDITNRVVESMMFEPLDEIDHRVKRAAPELLKRSILDVVGPERFTKSETFLNNVTQYGGLPPISEKNVRMATEHTIPLPAAKKASLAIVGLAALSGLTLVGRGVLKE